LGFSIEPRYRSVPPVVEMASGHWWSGYGYADSRRRARLDAWVKTRRRDPQLVRDAVWALVAGVTVCPVAAACYAAPGGGIYLVATGRPGWGAALIVAGVAGAPVAWRILGPIGGWLLAAPRKTRLDDRVQRLESIRADLTKTQAAEMERIERGLHDGAQARMVAVGMSISAAERLMGTDPQAAKTILAEAKASSAEALNELRALVRGINPPVLAERGLADAVRALALEAPIPVTVTSALPTRPERPIEAALYFAVAELVTNVVKHAHASHASVWFGYRAGELTATVADDGAGGAHATGGSGLDGVRRRLAAFDGEIRVESPPGGPTRVTVVAPCVL
jgi:signal transduction histidine kinase